MAFLNPIVFGWFCKLVASIPVDAVDGLDSYAGVADASGLGIGIDINYQRSPFGDLG